MEKVSVIKQDRKVAQKVMPHIFFLGNYLFKMYEIHDNITGCFLYTLFFHIISIYVYSLMPAQNKDMFPCTSPFPVHIATSSLHESHSYNLQTLSHTVHVLVAQKYENLKVPGQDYWGDGGAQSNQIWQLPPGFVDLCDSRHCRAESTCLLDSC